MRVRAANTDDVTAVDSGQTNSARQSQTAAAAAAASYRAAGRHVGRVLFGGAATCRLRAAGPTIWEENFTSA